MAFRLRRNLKFLELIAHEDIKTARAILSATSRERMGCVYELLINVRYSNIPVAGKVKKLMKEKHTLIRKLTDKAVGAKVRKKLLLAHLPLVISIIKAALPFIANGRSS